MQLHKLHIHTCSREGASSCAWSVLRGFLLSLAAQTVYIEVQKAAFSHVRMLVNSFSHQPECTSMPYERCNKIIMSTIMRVLGQHLSLCDSPRRPKSARLCEPPPLETATTSAPPGSAGTVSGLPLFYQKYTKCSRYPTERVKWGFTLVWGKVLYYWLQKLLSSEDGKGSSKAQSKSAVEKQAEIQILNTVELQNVQKPCHR